MSTTIIVSLVALVLFLMVTVAITMQTMEKNNREKRLRENGLKSRARNFQYMLDGFPEGFLSNELRLLVCKCLQEVYQQLNQLQPKSSEYTGQLERCNQQIEQIKNQGASQQTVQLTDSKQIRETQKLLSALFNYIGTLRKNNRINEQQAKAYATQIKQLTVQSSTDGLVQAAREAIAAGKTRLAIHHYQVAVEKLQKANINGSQDQKLMSFQQKLQELEQVAEEKEKAIESAGKEWDELDKEDESWKKNAIYD